MLQNLRQKARRPVSATADPMQRWVGSIGLTVAVGIAYFLAARLSLALLTKPDGVEESFGEQLGLTNDWAVRIIRAVGNYGEVFERNVGSGSRLGIPRGINAQWSNGGIQSAPPIR
jgi:hypothetical protein